MQSAGFMWTSISIASSLSNFEMLMKNMPGNALQDAHADG